MMPRFCFGPRALDKWRDNPIMPADTQNAARVCDRIAVAVLGVVTLVALATFRDYGLSWDDYAHSEYGDLLLAFYRSGFKDQRALSFVNLYRYGGGFDLLAALIAKVLPLSVFETRRLLGAAIGVLGLFVTWRTGRRVGGPLAGLVALALLAACPLYYGHMFMNPKDSPFAVAMAILLLGLVRMFEQYPRPTMAARMLVGGRLRPVDWLARPWRIRGDQCAGGARADICDRDPPRWCPSDRRAAWVDLPCRCCPPQCSPMP